MAQELPLLLRRRVSMSRVIMLYSVLAVDRVEVEVAAQVPVQVPPQPERRQQKHRQPQRIMSFNSACSHFWERYLL